MGGIFRDWPPHRRQEQEEAEWTLREAGGGQGTLCHDSKFTGRESIEKEWVVGPNAAGSPGGRGTL